jgi:hypothetical protein
LFLLLSSLFLLLIRLLLLISMLLLVPGLFRRDISILRESRFSFSFHLLNNLSKDEIVFITVSLALPLTY